jgi:conjugal transfer/entry exclusion protein
MKKYEQLENQIQELQKEVQRLKREERLNKLPDGFCIDNAKKVIGGNTNALRHAFLWKDTPQGDEYWRNIFTESKKLSLSKSDIIQIQRWIIIAQENKLNQQTK